MEAGKTGLIVLLICSAVYLLGRTQFYGNFGASGWWDAIVAMLPGTHTGAPDTPDQTGGEDAVPTPRPVRVAAIGTAGEGRWGMQYSAESDAFFEAAGGLLAEALLSADAPGTVSERTFRRALAGPGLYFDFLGEIPLRSLCLWLSRAENAALDQCAVRRIYLAQSDSGGATLFYINEGDGLYYACNLTSDLSARLTEAASARPPNGALFAFEAGAAYARVAPYVLLLPEAPSPQIYNTWVPLSQSAAEALSGPAGQLLRALGFNPQLVSVYAVPGEVAIRDGLDMLRISSAGVVTYQASEGGTSRYPAAAPLETAWNIAEAALGTLGGSARLYLVDMRSEPEGTIVRFGYCLDGAEVTLPDRLQAAEFIISEGMISEFTLVLRTYEPASSAAVLLPELQAAAVMEAGGMEGELLLRYEEQQGQCAPVWGVK